MVHNRDPGFTLFKAHDQNSGFKSKIGARFGTESMQGMRDAKYNYRH